MSAPEPYQNMGFMGGGSFVSREGTLDPSPDHLVTDLISKDEIPGSAIWAFRFSCPFL